MKKPNMTPGPWHNDSEGHILMADQVDFLLEDIGTRRAWQATVLRDEDGPSAVVALSHPDNAQPIAALPHLLAVLEKCITGGRSSCWKTRKNAEKRLRQINEMAMTALCEAGYTR